MCVSVCTLEEEGEAGRTVEIVFLDGTKSKANKGAEWKGRAHEEDGPMSRTELPAGRAERVYMGHVRLSLSFC